MKLINTPTYPGFPTPNIKIVTRSATRIILVDEQGLVPIIYAATNNVYQIPGGGVDAGEDILDAVVREARKETGCEIEILGEIEEFLDERPADVCKKGLNLGQTSYCYYGKVLSKGEHEFTDHEQDQGFELVWPPVDEVLKTMRTGIPRIPKAKIEAERDIMIFKAGYELLKNGSKK